MVDMDEFLYIVNDSLKSYLSKNIFDKCDFIKFHWATSTDNNLVHYDPRPLFCTLSQHCKCSKRNKWSKGKNKI